MVEAFSTDAAQQPLANRVRPRRLDRRSEHLGPASENDGLEVRTVFRIVVTNEILGRLAEGHRLPQLLRDPLVTR